MTYRIFKHNGQVLDRIDTYTAGASISTDARAADEVAEALSVDVSSITVEHVEVLPVAEATIPPQKVESDTDPDDELEAAISAATNLAELKAALLGQRSEAAVKGRPNK